MTGITGRRYWLACGIAFAFTLAATVPTTGDFGLTYDEPAYRYSQVVSAQWWHQLTQVRSWADLSALLDRDTLLYYWPYGRHGINFHPPLAGQLDLLTYATFGHVMKDIPARRMASVLEFSLTVTLLFGFLARRYGPWVGGVAAGALLFMPRLYGQAHLAETDTPGLFLWAAAAIAFWKGLYEPNARRWRVLVGIVLGLAFVEKMGTVVVLLPILLWLVIARLPQVVFRSGKSADWLDGILTTTAMLVPLGIAYREILRLSAGYLAIQRMVGISERDLGPARTNLFRDHPATGIPGLILAAPLAVWIVRRLLGRLFRKSPIWGAERPALEIFTAILAFAPVVGWLGNPAWWRETLPRLAHYHAISTARRGVLPDIQILYFDQIYEYSLPWHNAWLLIGITVPVCILFAAVVGLLWSLGVFRRDRLPLYFVAHMVALPIIRMLPTPAHDGVRLFLPTFFFVAAFAGWGTVAIADGLVRLFRARPVGFHAALAALVLAPAAWQLVRVHPYELSYYNELIGGPRGAWKAGFELSYWYDAFTPRTIAEINGLPLPRGSHIAFPNDLSKTSTFDDLQSLGALRADLILGEDRPNVFPYLWLLTHDSKAMAYTRLLSVLRPFYESRPAQLDGARVAALMGPDAAARALALQLLMDAPDRSRPDPPATPGWVRTYAPWLGRFWGEGVTKIHRLTINEPLLTWAATDPETLRAVARVIAEWARAHPEELGQSRESTLASPPFTNDPAAARLYKDLTRYDGPRQSFSAKLLRARPNTIVEAVEILITRHDAVRRVMLRSGFTDPEWIGGPLDQGFQP